MIREALLMSFRLVDDWRPVGPWIGLSLIAWWTEILPSTYARPWREMVDGVLERSAAAKAPLVAQLHVWVCLRSRPWLGIHPPHLSLDRLVRATMRTAQISSDRAERCAVLSVLPPAFVAMGLHVVRRTSGAVSTVLWLLFMGYRIAQYWYWLVAFSQSPHLNDIVGLMTRLATDSWDAGERLVGLHALRVLVTYAWPRVDDSVRLRRFKHRCVRFLARPMHDFPVSHVLRGIAGVASNASWCVPHRGGGGGHGVGRRILADPPWD